MTGDSVHLPNGGVYPPLIPVLMRVASSVMDPWLAAKLIALGSVLAVFAAVFAVGRQEIGWWGALLAAVAAAVSRPVTEPMAFGGYPQNVAVAACLLALWFQARLLVARTKRDFALATLFAVVAGLSHHMFFAFTFAASGLLVVLWVVVERPRPRATVARVRLPALAMAAGLAAFAPTYLMLATAGYAPPVNAGDATIRDAVVYGFREVELPWVALWTLAAVGVLWLLGEGIRSRRASLPLALAAGAMLITGSAGVFATAEARLLPAIALAAPLGAGLLAVEIDRWARNVAVRAALAAVPASLLVALFPTIDRVTEGDIAYYRMLNSDFLQAVEWSEAHPPAGAIAMTADPRAWPVGWWWRGLSEAPVLVGSKARWLAFEEERDEAEFVASLLKPRPSAETAALASTRGVTRLVAYRHQWVGWERWLREPEPAVRVGFANDTLIVLDFVAR